MRLLQHALDLLPSLVILALRPADLDSKDDFLEGSHNDHEQADENVESCESDWNVSDFNVLIHINQVETREVVTDS